MKISKRWFALALCCVPVGCDSSGSEPPGTTVRVHAHLDSAWHLTQLSLRSGVHETAYPDKPVSLGASETVTILLSDADADRPMHLDVWGLADGKRAAYGDGSVTPRLGSTTDLDVALAL